MSVLDTMKGTTPLVRRVTLCLNGALHQEYDALVSQLQDAAIADKDSLARENTTRVVDAMEDVRESMAAQEVTFSFKALPWFRRLALQGEHPPRDGDRQDKAAGYDTSTYQVALIRESCASVQGTDGEVVDDVPDDVWAAMFGQLNVGQIIDVLFAAAQNANDTATTVPLSARSLLGTQDSGASSKRPAPGTSPRNGSKGGSRRTSPKSTATTKAASSVS